MKVRMAARRGREPTWAALLRQDRGRNDVAQSGRLPAPG